MDQRIREAESILSNCDNDLILNCDATTWWRKAQHPDFGYHLGYPEVVAGFLRRQGQNTKS
jgi:hypothetical protein